MACQTQSSHGDKSAPWAGFGCRVSGQSFLSKIQKAAENSLKLVKCRQVRAPCAPEHLQQRPLPENPTVVRAGKGWVGKRLTYLSWWKTGEFLILMLVLIYTRKSPTAQHLANAQFKLESCCAKLLNPATGCAVCICAAIRPALVSFGILMS